jgi:hypothetical protein
MRRMMNRDRQRPAKAAVERCPGFPGSLPTGLLLSLLLVYPPTGAQWGPRAGGLWGEKRNPEKFILYGICKKWARELATAPDSRGRSVSQIPRLPPGREKPSQPFRSLLSLLPPCLRRPLLLVYPPTGAQWPARAGGLWGEKRNPEIFVLYGFRKKWARELAAAPDSRGRSRGRRRATHRTPRTRPQPAYPIPPNRPTLYLPTGLP